MSAIAWPTGQSFWCRASCLEPCGGAFVWGCWFWGCRRRLCSRTIGLPGKFIPTCRSKPRLTWPEARTLCGLQQWPATSISRPLGHPWFSGRLRRAVFRDRRRPDLFWFARKPKLARLAALAIANGAAIHFALPLGFPAASRDTSVVRGQEKYFGEIACHLAIPSSR